MTNTYDDLYAAVLQHPFDDDRRLILADCLEEQGEVRRADFIRTQCELSDLCPVRHCLTCEGLSAHGPNYWSYLSDGNDRLRVGNRVDVKISPLHCSRRKARYLPGLLITKVVPEDVDRDGNAGRDVLESFGCLTITLKRDQQSRKHQPQRCVALSEKAKSSVNRDWFEADLGRFGVLVQLNDVGRLLLRTSYNLSFFNHDVEINGRDKRLNDPAIFIVRRGFPDHVVCSLDSWRKGGPALVKLQPITMCLFNQEVAPTRKANHEYGLYRYRWGFANGLPLDSSTLPVWLCEPELWVGCTIINGSPWFLNRYDAFSALSRAAINYARLKAKLPKLTWPAERQLPSEYIIGP